MKRPKRPGKGVSVTLRGIKSAAPKLPPKFGGNNPGPGARFSKALRKGFEPMKEFI